MTQPPIDDDFQDRIQRILNEKKKEDLRKWYDMQFESHSENLSPQVESEWLDYITEFERQFENATEISVRERIGNPIIRLSSDIPDAELETELDQLLELLYTNNIVVDFINEVDNREAYRFITEELLDETVDDIRIPEMYSHFIYEEFHPNDEADVKQSAEEFLHAFFEHDDEMLTLALEKDELKDLHGSGISLEEFKTLINGFHAKYIAIMAFSVQAEEATVNGDYAQVDVNTVWQGLKNDGKTIARKIGISKIWLKRSPYSGWDVVQAKIAGWNQS
ncbi:MAG: hypothetical protein JW963_23510 [Anaerolineales bacterium]|nr:hypothetical protein [Anaerolineales bacterium]